MQFDAIKSDLFYLFSKLFLRENLKNDIYRHEY